MAYYTRVLSKLEDIPALDELQDLLDAQHPQCQLSVEEGDEQEWETLLLSGEDGLEIALIERLPVFDGSAGQDVVADFMEDTEDCLPVSGVNWLHDYLGEVKVVYSFQHLQGADFDEGSAALHGVRSALWERGSAIIQADHEGFTNEEGFHIVWQFSDSVSGAWNMAVLQDETWAHFLMDLGDPDHREAFQRGEVPPDVSFVHVAAKP